MELAERITRLEDRFAIQDLLVDYFLAADGDDLRGVAACFTEDAAFSSSGAVNASGRDQIAAFIGTARKSMGLTVHTLNYARLNFPSDDVAEGVVGAHLQLAFGETTLFGAVRYLDRYVRVRHGWLISARDMRTIHIAPWADVGDAFASPAPVRWVGGAPAASDFPRR